MDVLPWSLGWVYVVQSVMMSLTFFTFLHYSDFGQQKGIHLFLCRWMYKPNICSQLTPQCNNLHQSLHWIKQVNWSIWFEINSLFPSFNISGSAFRCWVLLDTTPKRLRSKGRVYSKTDTTKLSVPQMSNLDGSWPSCPSDALPAADGRSSAWHGTGLAGDRNRSWSQAAVAKQTSSALLCPSLKHVLRVILSKVTLPRSSQAGLLILSAWYGVTGLKGWCCWIKERFHFYRKINKTKAAGRKVDRVGGWCAAGLGISRREMGVSWQGHYACMTGAGHRCHSQLLSSLQDCSTFYLTHLTGFGMCPCQS